MKPLVIIESPSNLGLKEPSPGHEPGVRLLPRSLKENGFYTLVHPAKVYTLSPPGYGMDLDKASGVRNADAIARYAVEQATVLKEIIAEDGFPLVIGGDCSILIGNALALKETGRYGLFFLDGHTDFMWPSLSHTGGAAGMDLAIVTGHGHAKLTNIGHQKPYIEEKHVWCVGNREYTDWYVKAVEESSINYYDLNRLRDTGIPSCVEEFMEMIKNERLDGFWVHIDADVLDDAIMPAVDSRQEDGLTYDEFNGVVQRLLSSPQCTGVQLTILDPELDKTGEYLALFIRNFSFAINAARAPQ